MTQPFTNLSASQKNLLDEHLQATIRTTRSCDSLRDPLELRYIEEVVTKLYAGLEMQPPKIYILDSPMSCAFAWAYTPQTVADRWRAFHGESFYTHPLSNPVIDVITDGYAAFQRTVEHTISTSGLDQSLKLQYDDLDRVGDLVATAITSVLNPMTNSELRSMFDGQVAKYINDPVILYGIKEQPVPQIEHFKLPSPIFRGQHYTPTAYYQSLVDLGLPFLGYHKNLIRLWQQMNKACHWWFPYKNVLLLSDRHESLHVDDRGRPHNATGPAIEYRDGWKLYAWRGIMIPKEIVEKPEQITVERIMVEQNTEVRRAMVDIYGLDRFVTNSNSKRLDQQGEYELLRVPYLNEGNIIALKMRCPTTAAVYVHTVHPDCTTVDQALAWKRGEDDFRNARPYREGLLWER